MGESWSWSGSEKWRDEWRERVNGETRERESEGGERYG